VCLLSAVSFATDDPAGSSTMFTLYYILQWDASGAGQCDSAAVRIVPASTNVLCTIQCQCTIQYLCICMLCVLLYCWDLHESCRCSAQTSSWHLSCRAAASSWWLAACRWMIMDKPRRFHGPCWSRAQLSFLPTQVGCQLTAVYCAFEFDSFGVDGTVW